MKGAFALANTDYRKTAALTALFGNGFLAALKLAVGVVSGSSALVSDGVDSVSDVAIGAMTLLVVKMMSKPADAEHPWGHGRAETIATAVLSFLLFFVGAQLVLQSGSRLFFGTASNAPTGLALVTAVVSIVGKLLLALSQRSLGRRSGSSMIQANAKNMAGDVLISLGVLAGLFISRLTGSGVADAMIAVGIGGWVVKTSIGIFLGVVRELMDGSEGSGEYRTVFQAVKSVNGADNPHRARMRRIAGFWDIDLDIEVNPDITVLQAHQIACQVEAAVKARLDNVYDVTIHVEPHGDNAAEGFGLSEAKLNNANNSKV
jgi:cation diffusion facilitator family transporter